MKCARLSSRFICSAHFRHSLWSTLSWWIHLSYRTHSFIASSSSLHYHFKQSPVLRVSFLVCDRRDRSNVSTRSLVWLRRNGCSCTSRAFASFSTRWAPIDEDYCVIRLVGICTFLHIDWQENEMRHSNLLYRMSSLLFEYLFIVIRLMVMRTWQACHWTKLTINERCTVSTPLTHLS